MLTPSLLPRPVFTLQYQTLASGVLSFECQLLKPETQAYGILLNSPDRDNPEKTDGKILARQAACRTYSAENHAESGPQEDTAVFQETVTKTSMWGWGHPGP